MDECLFCKIISGKISAEKIYEDEATLAFLDIHPNNPGHTLVIPKTHRANIYELPDNELSTLMRSAKRLAIAVKKGVSADGINIAMNNDPVAGQVIFHAHIHVIPRHNGDGFTHWRGTPYKDGEAAKVGNNIRAAL